MTYRDTSFPRIERPLAWLALAGSVVLVGVFVAPREAWSGVLVSGVWGIALCIGALIWIAILAVTGASWWRPVRSQFLAVARLTPVPAVLVMSAVTLGMGALYSWAAPGAMEHNHLLHDKAAWLSKPFFVARAVVIVAIWIGFVAIVGGALRRFVASDARRDQVRLVRASTLFLVVMAPTLSVAFFDWTMSLEPEWFSTMYGVYGFAGALQGGIAIVAALSLRKARRDPTMGMTKETRHDFGRLLFAFSMFWAYIWFCQYMLIWYANLPEEVPHYTARVSGNWAFLFWLNPVVNFVIPFLVLLPAGTKRHAPTLFQVSLLVMAGRWLDVYLLVEPATTPAPSVPIYAVAATVALIVGCMSIPHFLFFEPRAQAPLAHAVLNRASADAEDGGGLRG